MLSLSDLSFLAVPLPEDLQRLKAFGDFEGLERAIASRLCRELPLALQAHGFEQVSTAYLAINLTPDNPATPPARARAIIEAQRRTRLDALHSLERMAPGAVSASELRELEAQLERRYAARRALYDAGERQWDASVSLTMVVRGVRP